MEHRDLPEAYFCKRRKMWICELAETIGEATKEAAEYLADSKLVAYRKADFLLESEPTQTGQEPGELNLSDEFVEALINDINQSDKLEKLSSKALIELLTNQVWGKLTLMTFESNLIDAAISRIDSLEAENKELRTQVVAQQSTITDLDISFHNLQPDTWKAYHKLQASLRLSEVHVKELAGDVEARDRRIKELESAIRKGRSLYERNRTGSMFNVWEQALQPPKENDETVNS